MYKKTAFISTYNGLWIHLTLLHQSYQLKCCKIFFGEETVSKRSILIEIVICRFRYSYGNGMLTQLVSQANSCDVILRGCCLVNLSLPGTPDHHVVPEVMDWERATSRRDELWGLILYTGGCTKPAQPSQGWSAGHTTEANKQRVLMHRHQGWNVRHGLCHIYMRYLYIYELLIAFVCFVVCSLL